MQISMCGDVGVILTATDVGSVVQDTGFLENPWGAGIPVWTPAFSSKVLGVHLILWRNRGDFLAIKKRRLCFY